MAGNRADVRCLGFSDLEGLQRHSSSILRWQERKVDTQSPKPFWLKSLNQEYLKNCMRCELLFAHGKLGQVLSFRLVPKPRILEFCVRRVSTITAPSSHPCAVPSKTGLPGLGGFWGLEKCPCCAVLVGLRSSARPGFHSLRDFENAGVCRWTTFRKATSLSLYFPPCSSSLKHCCECSEGPLGFRAVKLQSGQLLATFPPPPNPDPEPLTPKPYASPGVSECVSTETPKPESLALRGRRSTAAAEFGAGA